MSSAERDAKRQSAKTGFFARLGALLACLGSGASSLAISWLHGRLALAASLALAVTLALGASPAAASQPHAFLSYFGSTGADAGQFELTAESGLAVDQSTGDVYLADTGNHRVDEFSESGAFIRAFGWGVSDGAAKLETCGHEASPPTTTCQAGLPGPEPGQFEAPSFIAVDNTPGGAGDVAGDVYVADAGSVANERQTVTANATGGSYTLSYTSLIHAATTSGSNLVTGVVGRVGREGDSISGPVIPPGTTIARWLSPNSFELSANATASGRAVLGATETTASIAYNAPANQGEGAGSVEAALGALNAIGENGSGEAAARVSGSAAGPYTVEFVQGLADTNVPEMTCDGSGLTPSGAACTVATAIEGKNTARVQKFDSVGNLMTGWGGTPAPGEVDGTTCTECGYFPHFGEFWGVSVKPDGNLLVLDQENLSTSPSVDLLEWTQSSGEYVQSIATYGTGEPIGIAVDPAGRLYLGKGSSHPPFEVIQTSYCQKGEPSGFCSESNTYHENFPLTESAPATGVAVDPTTEDVYVAQFNSVSNHSDVAAYVHEGGKPFEIFGGGEIISTHKPEITEARGVAVSGATSDVYVADRGAGRVEIFAPAGNREALAVTRTGTSLGSVSSVPAGIACPYTCSTSFPEGEEVTLTATPPEYSSFLGWSGGGCSGTGSCQIALTAAASVTAAFAQDRPILTTAAASAVTRHTATLTGTVDPEGDASSCRFEYGPTSAYGAEASCASHPGSGAGPVAVSAQLWELAATTTYHYRLVSANTGGATYGPDETFTTLAEGCAVNTALCPALPVLSVPPTVAVVPPKPPGATTKALTNAQKLARALKACRKQKKKSVRLSCEKQAHRTYAPAKKKANKSTRSRKRG
jgi:hypothetical protein